MNEKLLALQDWAQRLAFLTRELTNPTLNYPDQIDPRYMGMLGQYVEEIVAKHKAVVEDEARKARQGGG